MLTYFLATLLTCGITPVTPPSPTSSVEVLHLRCEYLVDPVGIDTERPRLSWQLKSTARAEGQSAYQIRVASTLAILASGGSDAWDSGKVVSDEQNQIEFAGNPLKSHEERFWSVRIWDKHGVASEWSAPARWTMGIVCPEDWRATWITAPAGVVQDVDKSGPLPLFRRDFHMGKPVARALLYVCGLGFHEVHLNGTKVGESEFAPGWTDYRKTCLYSATGVTSQLRDGENAIGVMLGNGMYNVAGGRYVKFKGSFGPPKLILALHVEYTDGTVDAIGTDDQWRVTRGPILFSCIYGGEDYDAREEKSGWDVSGYDATQWANVARTEGPGGALRSATAPAIKVMQLLTPVSVTRISPGVYVYDMGKNVSGRPRITARGPLGASIRIIPGELLDDAGKVSQHSSGAPMWFNYTLNGKGGETWNPRFSYYGFRYLQVEGIRVDDTTVEEKDLPRLLAVTGEFTHASAEVVGQFECSNPLLNQIHGLILTAIRSNLQSVLTDCPHREKLGWLEVSHLLSDGLMYNFDLAQFYWKIQQDIADAQLESGLVPDITPEYTVFKGGFRDSPEWGSASVINPWNAWLIYGDRRIAESHYAVMQRYTDYLGTTATGHIVSHGLGDWYDVGPGGPGESKLTSKGLTATAIYYQDLCVLQQTAVLLGKPDDAKSIGALAEQVRSAFNTTFYHVNEQHYDRNSQTANAMPLALGLVDDMNREAQSKALADSVHSANYHVTAGDVGFSYVVRALTDAEEGDLMYQIVTQSDGPGYAYQVAHGATSLTEAWDSNRDSSQNHCMLGHVEGWFYRGLAGIRVDETAPGFRHFILRPQFPEGLDWVRATYESIRGPISSEWRKEQNTVIWTIQIPANSGATVFIPTTSTETLSESGMPLGETTGLSDIRTEAGTVRFEAASGTYEFRWTR